MVRRSAPSTFFASGRRRSAGKQQRPVCEWPEFYEFVGQEAGSNERQIVEVSRGAGGVGRFKNEDDTGWRVGRVRLPNRPGGKELSGFPDFIGKIRP